MSRHAAPLVSVLIPVWDGERFLAEAIESVLAQEYRPLDLIVVDDGSRDASATVAARYPELRLLRKPHTGLADSLNAGLAAARGALVAFLDADDRWVPGKLARQSAFLAGHPEVDVVFGHERRFYENAERRGPTESPQVLPGYSKSSLLIWRSALDRVGPFDARLPSVDFVEWYGRAQDAGLVSQLLPEVSYERRIHARNHGVVDRELQHATYLRVLKGMLDRRRGGSAA